LHLRPTDPDRERRDWERFNAALDALPPPPPPAPPPPAPKPRRQPARRSLPAPRPRKGFAAVSDMLERDGRLSCSDLKLGLWLVRTARGRASIDAFIDQMADAIGRSARQVQRAQRNLEACGYITVEHVREGRINDANVYHLLAPLLAPEKRRAPSRRAARGVTKKAPHEEASERTLPSELVAAREGDADGAGRAEVGSPGEPGRPAARAIEGQWPTATPSRAPLAAQSEPAIDTRAMRAARQGASAISPRAPP
jgi:hypothetical protein